MKHAQSLKKLMSSLVYIFLAMILLTSSSIIIAQQLEHRAEAASSASIARLPHSVVETEYLWPTIITSGSGSIYYPKVNGTFSYNASNSPLKEEYTANYKGKKIVIIAYLSGLHVTEAAINPYAELRKEDAGITVLTHPSNMFAMVNLDFYQADGETPLTGVSGHATFLDIDFSQVLWVRETGTIKSVRVGDVQLNGSYYLSIDSPSLSGNSSYPSYMQTDFVRVISRPETAPAPDGSTPTAIDAQAYVNYELTAGHSTISYVFQGPSGGISFGIAEEPYLPIGTLQSSLTSSNENISSTSGEWNLANTVYGIYSDSDCANLVDKISLSDLLEGVNSNSYSPLVAGEYYLRLIDANKNYQQSSTITPFEIKQNQTTAINLALDPITVSIPLVKLSSNPDITSALPEYSLLGAEYALYRSATTSDAEQVCVDENYVETLKIENEFIDDIDHLGTTNSQQYARYNDAGDEYNYFIKETLAPTSGHYTIDSTIYPITQWAGSDNLTAFAVESVEEVILPQSLTEQIEPDIAVVEEMEDESKLPKLGRDIAEFAQQNTMSSIGIAIAIAILAGFLCIKLHSRAKTNANRASNAKMRYRNERS